MEKINELSKICKASVCITINLHKDYYQSVSDYVEDDKDHIDPEILSEMVKQNTCIEVQFYPSTPVGFYVVYHYDLNAAVDMALEIAKEECQIK